MDELSRCLGVPAPMAIARVHPTPTAGWVREHPVSAACAVALTLSAPTAFRLWQGIRLLGGRRPAPLPPVRQPVRATARADAPPPGA
jgi:hypothetical protein